MLGGVAAVGAQAPSLADRAAAINQVLTEREGNRVVVGHISRVLTIAVDKLRLQQMQTGLSWGEMLVAHRLSQDAKTAVTFEQVVAEFKSGKSWEDIARAYKADLSEVTAAVQRSQTAVEQRSEDRAPPPITGSPTAAPPGTSTIPQPGRRGY